MADDFATYNAGLSSPAQNAAAVTPHNDNDLANASRALWVGGEGDVAAIFVGQSTPVVLKGVPAGTLLPIRVSRVRSTDTSATDIVALW